MYARLALHRFASPGAAAAAERNLRERVLPILRRQPGVTAFWGRTPDRADGLSCTLGDDPGRLLAGGRAINAAPALPGQDLATIRDPETVHFCAVVAAATGTGAARAGRLAWLGSGAGDADGAAAFAPALGELPGLARAYLLREAETGRYCALVLAEGDDALDAAGAAIAEWDREPANGGGEAAPRAERVVTYAIFLHLATGADAAATPAG